MGGTNRPGISAGCSERMSDPLRPGRRLEWEWVIDYYHACEYIYQAGRGAVLRRAGGRKLGAEDAPLAEGEAAGDLPGVALGGGDPTAADHGRGRSGSNIATPTPTCGSGFGSWIIVGTAETTCRSAAG